MKKAIIIYNSKTGTTKQFGEGIYNYLQKNGIVAHINSIDEFNYCDSPEYDLFFLGCWTSGLLFFLQRPEKIWIDFAQKLPPLRSDRTILFTTYKIRTGSMFREMRKGLRFSDDSERYGKLKSRNGKLNIKNQMNIDETLNRMTNRTSTDYKHNMKENKEKKESYRLFVRTNKNDSEQKYIHGKSWLRVAAMLSFSMAAIQLFISIFPDAAAYFEAPPSLLDNRLLLLFTGGIATLILVIFGLYALSGSGKIRRLPLVRLVLVSISCLFLLRGSFIVLTVLKFLNVLKGEILIRGLISHLVFLVTGIVYTGGTILNWREMRKRI